MKSVIPHRLKHGDGKLELSTIKYTWIYVNEHCSLPEGRPSLC